MSDPMQLGSNPDSGATFREVPTNLSEPELSADQVRLLQAADAEFDQLCRQRYEAGRKKYGKLTFLEMPTIQMALEEIIDFANYARFTYAKLRLLEMTIQGIQETALPDGFYPTSTVTEMRKPV